MGGIVALRQFLSGLSDPFDLETSFQSVIDTIIPADEFDGAVEAGIHGRLLTRYQQNTVFLERLTSLLKHLDGDARTRYDRPFHKLALTKRTALLEEILAKGFEGLDRGYTFGADLLHIRKETMDAFYTGESGYAMLNYRPPVYGGYPDYDQPPSD